MRLVLSCLVLGGCLETLDGKGSETTGDTGLPGTDTTDTTDTDTLPTSIPDTELDCDADYATPSPGTAAGSCLTDAISCGDTIYGTLDGGSNNYDYDYWLLLGELDSLMGEFDALDGPERAYSFQDGSDAFRVTVHSCFDHWVNWVIRGEYCNTDEPTSAGVFEGGTGRTWYTELPGGGSNFEFIIEGLYGATGNYVITVECF